MDRRQRAEELDVRRWKPDLLLRLSEGRRREILVVRFGEAARERDLTRMPAQVLRPLGEQQRRLGLADQ
jgi:hypothetical protein